MDSVEEVNVLPVNEEDNPLSINVNGWMNQVPLSVTGAINIHVLYMQQHQRSGTEADMDATINMPPQMINALLAYIGWKTIVVLTRSGRKYCLKNSG